MPKIEEDGKSWLRRPKLYKGVVEPYKKNLRSMQIVIVINKMILVCGNEMAANKLFFHFLRP